MNIAFVYLNRREGEKAVDNFKHGYSSQAIGRMRAQGKLAKYTIVGSV